MTELTNDIYWAAQPLAVQALRTTGADGSAERIAAATTLARQGYTIDYPIMIWGWDADKVMSLREMYGDIWAPSFLMPTPVNINDCTHPPIPPGAIKVSTNAADYPAVPPPPPPPDPSPGGPQDWVGIATGGGYYAAKASALALPDGFKATPENCISAPCKAGLTLVLHKWVTPFGTSCQFQVVA